MEETGTTGTLGISGELQELRQQINSCGYRDGKEEMALGTSNGNKEHFTSRSSVQTRSRMLMFERHYHMTDVRWAQASS